MILKHDRPVSTPMRLGLDDPRTSARACCVGGCTGGRREGTTEISVLMLSQRSKGNVGAKTIPSSFDYIPLIKVHHGSSTTRGWTAGPSGLPLFLHRGWTGSVFLFVFSFFRCLNPLQSALIPHRVRRSSWRSTPGQPVLSCYGVSFCGRRPCVPKPRAWTR